MKPIEHDLQISESADPDTGRPVTRLLPEGQTGSHAYFTATSFDADNRLILGAEIDGRGQLLRMDLERGTLHQLTILDAMRLQIYAVCPARNTVIVIDGQSVKEVDLGGGGVKTLFEISDRWRIHLPTVDAAGTRVAFAVSEQIEGFTATDRIYSTMEETFFFRPKSMIVVVDLETGQPRVAWGEHAWISHVLINPVDPDTIVFCHEGGSYNQHRLWVVDARSLRKKESRCLYRERFEDFLVHEYFVADGTLGVQLSVYPEDDAQTADHDKATSYVMFLDMDGLVVGNYRLPGNRSGHVQSNSDNSLVVADGYFPRTATDSAERKDGGACMALHTPDGNRLRTEKLCRHNTSGKTQLSHAHPIFSPDDKKVLYSSDVGGTNSPYLVDVPA